MKILNCGKGGCGKSTIAAMLAKHLAERGHKVLVVDADESNVGLYRMLGLGKTKTLAECLGGRKCLRKFRIPKATAPRTSLWMARRFLSLTTICITGSIPISFNITQLNQLDILTTAD